MSVAAWSLKILKLILLGLSFFALLIGLIGSGYLVFFNSVSHKPSGPSAEPILQNITLSEWEAHHVPILKDWFQQEIYGIYPPTIEPLQVIERTTLDSNALNQTAIIEEFTLSSPQIERLHVVLVTPKNITTPIPLIIGQNFCGNHNTFPFSGVSKPSGFYHADMCDDFNLNPIINIAMGKHLNVPPLEAIIAQGYGFAGFYPGEIAPDHAQLAPVFLDRVGTQGTLMAWAWGFDQVADFLGTDNRFDTNRIAAFGHSRYGKAALIAAAFSPNISLVIAHQSGTGGASLGKSGIGESIQAITSEYPHWFHPNYQKYATDPSTLPIDQHQLIALAAPTPILLGNGQHDKWSDPQTAFQALAGATPIYEIHGQAGLDQPDLTAPNFKTNLSFHMRAGLHGTRGSDWKAFLAFLKQHF